MQELTGLCGPGDTRGIMGGSRVDLKRDDKSKQKDAPPDHGAGEEAPSMDQPTDMETALRCIQLLDDLKTHGQEMVEGILATIRNISGKMTNPCAKKIIEDRVRDLILSRDEMDIS